VQGTQNDLNTAARACSAFSILDLCELAHRDVTRQALHLRDEDIRTEEIRDHLSACMECGRYYRSACAAYTRLCGDVVLSLQPVAPYTPRARTAEEISAAAELPGVVLQRVEGLGAEGEGLDALNLFLEWKQESRTHKKGGGRWSVTLKLLAQGNDPEFGYEKPVLERFDGYAVQFERLVRGRDEPDRIMTRLSFDAEQNLVSIPRTLGGAGPTETATITLTLLDRANEVVGD